MPVVSLLSNHVWRLGRPSPTRIPYNCSAAHGTVDVDDVVVAIAGVAVASGAVGGLGGLAGEDRIQQQWQCVGARALPQWRPVV